VSLIADGLLVIEYGQLVVGVFVFFTLCCFEFGYQLSVDCLERFVSEMT